ncbi:MAG: VOC family protein [Pyrinomonadaceae bacterium]
MSLRLGKIMIFVSDVAEAKRFYCDVLGFPLKLETENRLEFAHECCDFIAFKCEKNAAIEDYGNAARSVFVFEVDSVEKTMRDLKTKGVKFLHEKPSENEFSRYAAFADSFGNVHEIFEPK